MNEFSFDDMTPTQFEELCFNLLHEIGFVNLDWRKGTGKSSSPADRGRDIVCQLEREDIDEAKMLETWFVDCKHYQKAVPPKELDNLLTWSQADLPDVALFIVSNFLSNGAKDHLQNYRTNRRPPFKIKYWERPRLEKWVAGNERLIKRYSLKPEEAQIEDPDAVVRLGAFMQNWLELEAICQSLVSRRMKIVELGRRQPITTHLRLLSQWGVISPYVMDDLDQLRRIRNDIVHGAAEPKGTITQDLLARIRRLNTEMERLLRASPAEEKPGPTT